MLTQSSLRVHLAVAAATIVSGIASQATPGEWCLLLLAIGIVLMAELVNTAIETLARGPGSRQHPRLRDALDIASAAVLVASVTAALIGAALVAGRIARPL